MMTAWAVLLFLVALALGGYAITREEEP